MNRFIKSNQLPGSLWCKKSKSILLPERLVELWTLLLKKNDLFEMAKEKAPKGFVGGVTKEDTDKHLAWRYNGSCARVMLSILDPSHDLDRVSDAYASTFAGNEVFLADIPSGSGAALVSILCTLSDLRMNHILPRHPLNIKIVAGEISHTAREYMIEQLQALEEELAKQAIWIEYEAIEWNALDPISTTDLIRRMTIASQYCTARLLVLSNFSGFLEAKGNWGKAKPQFDEIFRHSRDSLSTAIWIEPQKNNVANFVTRAIDWFKNSFKSLIGDKVDDPEESWYAKTVGECQQPIKEGVFSVRLTVMRFDLPMENNK